MGMDSGGKEKKGVSEEDFLYLQPSVAATLLWETTPWTINIHLQIEKICFEISSGFAYFHGIMWLQIYGSLKDTRNNVSDWDWIQG